MKTAPALTLLLCLLTVWVQAQPKTIEKNLAVPANKKVELKLPFGDKISVTAWDKKEAAVKVTYEINGGKFNEALLLSFDADSESARVEADFDKEQMKTGRAEDCPDGQGQSYRTTEHGKETSRTCYKITYEVFVPVETDLSVETINCSIDVLGLTGPIKAHSINGALTVKPSRLNQGKPSDISSINGKVDITLPNDTNADVKLNTINGGIFTNFDIDQVNENKTGLTRIGGRKTIHGKTNNGGVEMKVSSINSNIYVRKQK